MDQWLNSAPDRERQAYAKALVYAQHGARTAAAPQPLIKGGRGPVQIPDADPLTIDEVETLVLKGENLSSADLDRLRFSMMGFSPKRCKGGVEEWMFHYFLDNPQVIIPRLWLGAVGRGESTSTGSQNEPMLRSIGISHVLCLGDMSVLGVYKQHKGMEYNILENIADESEANIAKFFHEGTAFIHQAVQDGSAHVLVHCMAGEQRCACFTHSCAIPLEHSLSLTSTAP
jgi:hypothetical protein